MDDSTTSYNAQYDAATNAVALWEREEKSQTNVLAYSWVDADHVVLQGQLGTNALSVHLHQVDMSNSCYSIVGFTGLTSCLSIASGNAAETPPVLDPKSLRHLNALIEARDLNYWDQLWTN